MIKNKEYRTYRKLWKVLPKKKKVSKVPLNLDIELTNRCNKNPPCSFCPYHGEGAVFKRDGEDMDFELYSKIIKECGKKGTKAIKLSYAGEPLLYRYLPEAITLAKDSGILEVMFNTNGLLLDNGMIMKLIASKLDKIILSDYGLQEQYEAAIRVQSLKQLFKSDTPILRIKTYQNKMEKWKGIADEFSFHTFYNYELESYSEVCDFECYQPWVRFLVLTDGIVLMCSCGILLPDKVLGDAWEESIEELWNSNRMNYLRFCHTKHCTELIESCTKCPDRILYLLKNKQINIEGKLYV